MTYLQDMSAMMTGHAIFNMAVSERPGMRAWINFHLYERQGKFTAAHISFLPGYPVVDE